MLERLGVTDADARQIIETAKVPNTGNGPTHFIPAYDLMYYVNDVNRENTEVLTLGSRYNSDTSFVYGQQRLYADHEGESETYLYDGRGSVVQLLKDGAVTQEYAYDAYGYINADEFGIQAPFYGYNGEEQNPFTGLQYLRARYYAPQNGGFITQDSFSGVLTNALSQNRYAYAHNNPVNYADPSGHFAISGGTALLVLGGTLLVTAITTVVAMVTSSVSTTRKSNTSRFTYTPSPKPPILTFPAPAPQVPMAETFPAPSPQLPTILKSPSPVVAGAIILTILTQPQTKKLNLLPTPMEEATDRSIYFSRRYSCDVSSTDPHIAAQGPVSSVESAAEFERRISSLSPSERVAAVKEKAAQVAEQNGWKKDSKVMSKNPGRTIYYDRAADEYYSVDTQHGRLERENWRGKHLGEVDMDLNPIPDSVDPSGKHDINV